MVTVTVNGETRQVDEGTTLAALLESLKIARGMVAVSRNQEIVHRDQYPAVKIQEGDVIEIVRMVGGG